jgi:hypothetical protein
MAGVTATTLVDVLSDMIEKHGDDLEVAISVSVSGQPLRLDLIAVAPDSAARDDDELPPPPGAPLLWLCTNAPPSVVPPLAPRRTYTRADV